MLRIEGSGDRAEVSRRVVAILDEFGYVGEQVESPVIVDRWFDAASSDALSQEEAQVLAQRWTDEMLAEHVIETREPLLSLLPGMLFEGLRTAARTGATEDIKIRIDEPGLRRALDPTEAGVVIRWLRGKLT